MKNTSSRMRAFTLAVLGIFALTGFSQAQPIELGYVQWDSEVASTHVVAAVLEDELGYEVNLTAVDAGPMWAGIAQGDFDAMVAAWLPFTHEPYWEQFGDQLVDLGPNLEGAVLGWVVPSYVPVESIAELAEYASEFNNEIIGIDPGAGLTQASEEALEVYGLEGDYTLLTSSDAAMTAALDRAVNREEWIVVTGWVPHWKFAAYDLRILEDPENALGDEEQIHTILSQGFADSGAEDAIAFLDAFNWNSDQMSEVMVMVSQDGMEPFEAARSWIADNPETVQSWLE